MFATSAVRLPQALRAVPCSARRASRPAAATAVPSRPSGGGARFGSASFDASAGNGAAPAAAPATPAGDVQVKNEVLVSAVLPPPAVYQRVADMGAYKASLPWWKTILLGVLAGAYVSLGGALLLTVGPNCGGIGAANVGLQKYITGAIGFPFALLTILTVGSELFTGNTALLTVAVLEGKATLRQLLKSWVCSFSGNVIGCALGVALFANSGLMPQLTAGATGLATVKVAYPLKETLIKAVCANWFVCIAVWQSVAAQTYGGKFIACLGPVSAFVCVGLEHCIANMFFVPLGILAGANVTFKQFLLSNLLPVTLGNIFAGTFCMATMYCLIYGRLGKQIEGKA